MGLLTIGAFARAAGLSPKALRLYDEYGLLRPASVDGDSGYRLYDPAQLDRARLIAWLRRLGMPLARIREVVDAEQPGKQVGEYWDQVVEETAARGRLAKFLVDYLDGRAETGGAIGLRYAARTDRGMVRASNEDAAYAGGRLLAVADGVSGADGGSASAAAIEALKPLRALSVPVGEVLEALAGAVGEAEKVVRAATTLTAMLWSGSHLGLVHIGDSRAYVLRDGGLFRITHDHTWVQALVDEGRLSAEEAESHPKRALLARAIIAEGGHKPDLSVHDARPGDRYLLCSDGLSRVVPAERIRERLSEQDGPDETVEALIALAYEAGAPDNIACVVADVVPL